MKYHIYQKVYQLIDTNRFIEAETKKEAEYLITINPEYKDLVIETSELLENAKIILNDGNEIYGASDLVCFPVIEYHKGDE